MAITKRTKNSSAPEVTAKYYLSNSKMLPEVIKSKNQGYISDELAKMLMMLARKYAQKPCFYSYTYKEDMISEALANLCQNALKFNPEKSDNPFSFYTSCIHNSYLQFLNIEKKHRRIRDQLLVDMGENPSFNFSDEAKNGAGGEFSSELSQLSSDIHDAKIRVAQEAVDKANADALAIKEARWSALVDEGFTLEEAMAMEAAESEVEAEVIVEPLSLLDFGNDDETV